MEIMKNTINIPNELLSALQNRRCVLFAGAGLSINAGYPKWTDLIDHLIDIGIEKRIIRENKATELKGLNNSGIDPLMIAQELSDFFGRESFLDEIAKIYDIEGHEPTELHNALPELPFKFVLTTNYDQLIENAYVKPIGKIPKTYTHRDAADFSDALWRGDFFILKVHGDVIHKSSIVLTKRDYREIIFSAPGYRAVMSAIFTTKSVLFLGVSLNDPEIDLLLSYLHDAFHGSGQYHYVLIPENQYIDTISNRWRKDYKVHCITYQASPGHPEVLEFVKDLIKSV